jgi:hypothetical protein
LVDLATCQPDDGFALGFGNADGVVVGPNHIALAHSD